MKTKAIFTFFLLLITVQKTIFSQGAYLSCSGISSSCNKIMNPSLTENTSTATYWNAFYLNDVNFWFSSHGDPNLHMSPQTPPFTATGVNGAYMFSDDPSNNAGEGITGKMAALISGDQYTLTFYMRRQHSGANDAVDYNIYLMHCSDASTYFTSPNSPAIPTMPSTKQQIFCNPLTTASGNLNWTQVTVTFTANDNYDMVWIFPSNGTASQPKIGFGYPELISKTDFHIVETVSPTNTCSRTLQASCTVKNATYQWALNGTPISGATLPTLAINTLTTTSGTITLTVTLPNNATYNNNTCSTNGGTLTANYTIQACDPFTGPIVYDGKAPAFLGKSSTDIFVRLHEGYPISNINHQGSPVPTPSPTPPYLYAHNDFLFQYGYNGVNTWTSADISDQDNIAFILSSGKLQIQTGFSPITSVYVNGSTGASTTSPSSVPTNELIIAETSGGDFITKTNTTVTLQVSTPSTVTPGFTIDETKFNPSSGKLYVRGATTLKVYTVSGSTIGSPTTITLTGNLLQIDNNDDIYIMSGGVIAKYNGLGFSPVTTITGFTNSNLAKLSSSNPYTEDRCVVVNTNNNYLYAVNFNSGTYRRILLTNHPGYYGQDYYMFDGNKLYLTGITEGTSYSIGSRPIPCASAYLHSIYITSFDLISDFTTRTSGSIEQPSPKLQAAPAAPGFSISINPNPASDRISVTISTAKKVPSNRYYRVQVTGRDNNIFFQDITGKTTYTQYIGNLKAGVYFITITNENGEKQTKSFLKL